MLELVPLFIMLLFSFILASINPTRIIKTVLCIEMFIIGLFIVSDGIALNGVALLVQGSQLAFITFVVLTLGSIVTIYSLQVGDKSA